MCTKRWFQWAEPTSNTARSISFPIEFPNELFATLFANVRGLSGAYTFMVRQQGTNSNTSVGLNRITFSSPNTIKFDSDQTNTGHNIFLGY